MTQKKRMQGFTLLEIAVVVAILGLILGGGLVMTAGVLEKAALNKTQENLDKIDRALAVYMLQNTRLPCPYNKDDNGTGCINTADPAMPATMGIAPYNLLGLKRHDVMDGWNRYITYAVDDDYVLPGDLDCNNVDFETVNADASLQLRDSTDSVIPDGTTPGEQNLRAIYTLIAHGKNGFGAYMKETVNFGGRPPSGASGQELQNAAAGSDSALFYYESVDTIGFDDIVRGKSAAALLYDAGCRS